MFKSKRAPVLIGTMLVVMLGWLAFGPRILAGVSHITYRGGHYSYDVSLDTFYEARTNSSAVSGIVVVINPERPAADASAFSEAYIEAAQERAYQWAAERRGDEPVDVMVLFARPLTLEEANSVLDLADATVFESGVVGYFNGAPFAAYAVETGQLLAKPLEEIAESNPGFVAEEGSPDAAGGEPTADVRGYLAVRAWVPVEKLDYLLGSAEVRLVDTTPQEVRDRLAESGHWKNMPVTSLALEMPLWAYDWKR